MRIAAFGDIHSNHIALRACLDAAEHVGADMFVFLGDYVSDCACPQKTLELLRGIEKRVPCRFIRGNREEYMLDHADGKNEWFDNSQSGSLLYTYENLKKADLDWFRRMPIAMKVEPDGCAPFEICHGAPWQTRVMLLPGTEHADRVLSNMRTGMLLCAHTHETFVIKRDGRLIVNGGAVGLPTNGKPGAGFALIDWQNGEWSPRLISVEYDVGAVLREFRESGFMERGHVWARAIAKMLRTGSDESLNCLKLVEEYACETGLPFSEESLWLRAAEKLGI